MLRRLVLAWLPFGVAAVALTGVVYVTAQQLLRLGANDPQIQLAHDAASALMAGQDPREVLPPGPMEISSSLAPFGLVYDLDGTVLASTAGLQGEIPELPEGVREFARDHGEDRVTWQPEEGVRIAAVVVPFAGGTVLMGRSLREVEHRIDTLGQLAVIGLAATLLATLASVVISVVLSGRSPQ
jgi:hypothetical protein